jgi:hypothetical protein
MSINYNWVISSMEEYIKTENDLTDVVFLIHWRRTASLIQNEKEYYADKFDVLRVAEPDVSNFTPYNDLTFDQICGWLETNLDVVSIDIELENKINAQLNPKTISLPFPWDSKI